MTTELSNSNDIKDDNLQGKESAISSSSNTPSFSNYIDKSEIISYKSFLRENIKSFNLLKNEENSTKENELENTLKAKYNFDTPILEIVLKVTTDYDLIQNKLKEYLELFGEFNSLKYDHNANTVKIIYKYYFSCLYANRSLTNVLQEQSANSAINYYSNCEFNYPTNFSEKQCNKHNSNKEFNQAFKFLTENYKTNAKFKTQIYREENNEKLCLNNNKAEEVQNGGIVEKRTNIEESKKIDNSCILSPKLNTSIENGKSNTNSYNTLKAKNKWINKSNNYGNRKKVNYNSFINPMNSMIPSANLFYQYLSMNNPNTIKIPVPVPIPVPIPMTMPSPKFNKNNNILDNNNDNHSSFPKTKIKSSCLNKTKDKENIPISLNKTQMQTESPQMNSFNNSNSNNINNFCDSIIDKVNTNEDKKNSTEMNDNSSEKKSKSSDIEISNTNKNEEKDSLSDKENISSSSNISGKSSQENNLKNDKISSIKFIEKSNLDFLGTVEQKKLSLDRLNYFLQNNKPISNFNNPSKNLNSNENEISPKQRKSIPMPIFYPFPMQFPFKFPRFNKIQNQYLFPGSFNKNIIDFDKLTLNTKNTIKFDTYSSRDYYYKYVCNYLVQIPNDDHFFVTKRIIGKNGCFLKKIIQEACIKYGDFSTKIRLRGKGSGYLEQNGKESEEPLMLCVSSLNYPTYINCCMLLDSLFKKVYNDYYDYLLKVLPKELQYSINKKKVLKHEFVVNRFASGSSGKNKENKNSNNAPHNDDISSQDCLCDSKAS